MQFITKSLYRTIMLLLRILGRLYCDFIHSLKSCIFNLHINSIRKEY